MSFVPPSAGEVLDLRDFAEELRFGDTVGPDGGNAGDHRRQRHGEIILALVESYFHVQSDAADVFQQKCLRTVKSEPGNPTLTLCALGLGGETGEVIEPVKKHLFHGKPLDPKHVMLELGDVLWYTAVMAHELGWSLSDVMAANVAKLEARHLAKAAVTDSCSSECTGGRCCEGK